MKLIAISTIHGQKKIRDRNPQDFMSRDVFKDLIASPGVEFDSEEFGIDDAEAQTLIDRKVAKRKTREVADDGDAGRNKPLADPLQKLTVAELSALAADRKVEIKPGATKPEIIAELNKASAPATA